MAGRVRARLTAAEGRRFGLTLGVAFGVLAGLSAWRGHGTPATVLGGLALALALAGLIVPTRLGPVERAWMGFARLLSRVTTPVFLGVIFYLVITPIGWALRLLGRDPLAGGRGRWVERTAEEGRGTMMNQF